MSENILLGYVIGNKENIDGGWKAKILGIRALVLPEFKEVTCDIKELSPKQLEFFGADSGNIENITDINFIYRRLSSEEFPSFFFEVNYSDRCCSLKCITFESDCNYNILYNKDYKPLYYILKGRFRNSQMRMEDALKLIDVEYSTISMIIHLYNSNYAFNMEAEYIPKICGYKLGIESTNFRQFSYYYCIDGREVDYDAWDLAKRDIRIDDYIRIKIDSDIASEYLMDIGEFTIFNNTYMLNSARVNHGNLIVPKECKNLYCKYLDLSRFNSIVIPPNLEKFWYYYPIRLYDNEEDARDYTVEHKDTKFYFSRNAPASQLYAILSDLITDYYKRYAYNKCTYNKCDNKLENVKTVEDVLEVLYDATDYINIELY